MDNLLKISLKISQLRNQKQINSWTGLEKLSCKVVYDSSLKKYIGVFARKWIRCWDKNVSNINAVKKIKVFYSLLLECLTLLIIVITK